MNVRNASITIVGVFNNNRTSEMYAYRSRGRRGLGGDMEEGE